MVKHTEFATYLKRAYKNPNDLNDAQKISVFAASVNDINKIDLPPHRPGVDIAIEIEKDEQDRIKDLPRGSLYGMSRDELLCLRKELTELLDRNWIRASNSPGGAPVLFVKKPAGGLRFCVDYRSLNAITKKDRYPLPLIKEIFRSLTNACWLTKIDVSAAFHRIRVTKGDEWKTALQTRFGLYEWLVMPFGLTGAPAAWQRWINELLRDYLDQFCTAYLDDVLIWSNGSQEDHFKKVSKVLKRLSDAGLKLDLKKCDFAVNSVKYLGFIITVGKGISVDPDKQVAIEKWELPRTQTAVRSFLGFANFYQDFINDFAELSAPLQRYTKKEFSGKRSIQLDQEAQKSFETLKKHFITTPILALFNPELKTVLETDCSGWAMGACLSQWDHEEKLRPIGYFSKKLSPAECNYDIHDKELLAIIRVIEFWRAELMCLRHPVEILTDHKNLQYFMTKRTLSERQIQWKTLLDKLPSIKLRYRPGRDVGRSDALSRMEQDTPKDLNDPRLRHREKRLIEESLISALDDTPVDSWPNGSVNAPFEDKELNHLWNIGVQNDGEFRDIKAALEQDKRCFPPSVKTKISISECSLDTKGNVKWRGRLLIPQYEPLQTELIQKSHDSPTTGHPGRESTLSILSRDFYWPRMSHMVRQFVRNCDVCGRTHVWRDKKRGFLKPLPVPERFHQELSIDFMIDLPAKKDQPQYLMVITDRLSKEITLEVMTTVTAEACAKKFLHCFYRFHGFPRAIVSDRGSNWVGDFWTRLCEKTGIKQRLSTAFHPQTDICI
ncbi:Transposon Tf2-6 polyprotein [Podosphaera aphanis]|nr:Transposon Tf2-6 polyprotein [Podosphaera aphanis]